MFNILIDPLPKEYEGYLIRWQFYNGILISQILSNEDDFTSTDFGQIEKLYSAFELFYGKGIPPFEIALEGLKWFYNCGMEEKTDNTQKKQLFCFESDKNRLFSAFMVKYDVNLNKANDLHWFEFISMMNDLDKTAFRNIVDIRAKTEKEIKKYSKDVQAEIRKQQKIFAIEKTLDVKFTDEQTKAIDHFDKLVGLK